MKSDMKSGEHKYFDHDADIGVRACANTLEEVFVAMARGVFAIMCDLDLCDTEPQKTTIDIEFVESDVEFALVEWLNQLLGRARVAKLYLCHFELTRDGDHWKGKAFGVPWSDEMHLGTEVKGATLTQLSVKQQNNQWIAQLVVDV